MTPRVLPFVPHTSYFELLITSVRCFSLRIEVFTCCSQCRFHTKKKWNVHGNFLLKLKLLNIQTLTMKPMGPEDVSEEIFSEHESFCEHDTESEEDGGSGNRDVNNSELFS
ncbi:hypothetical protein AVEN_227156-1 [Araneus ventricosus]|uniref:Uncharacterized protein n=1 Tax=Araneus ventricosus TaxID=182803 RepID=A0A4Y2BUI7_ARAVE|nr:hypothetical protein AVEN_227156-1 [Araneus ventricosus]